MHNLRLSRRSLLTAIPMTAATAVVGVAVTPGRAATAPGDLDTYPTPFDPESIVEGYNTAWFTSRDNDKSDGSV